MNRSQSSPRRSRATLRGRILSARSIFSFLLLLSLVPLPHGTSASNDARRGFRSADILPGQILVKYRNRRAASATLRSMGAVTAQTIPQIGVSMVQIPEGTSVEAALAALAGDPDIEFAEPNGVYRALAAPNDPDYTDQYALQATKLNMEAAWDITTGSPNVVIAIVDTGVLLTHPDLIDNLWTNPAPSGNSGLRGTRIQIDWNNDGDCTDNPGGDLGPEQCASSDPTDNTTNFHGTRVAGIAAATTDNNTNMAGIARGCRIMAVKVLNSAGTGSFAAIAAGVLYAADNGAAVINLSLGGVTASATVTAAIEYALSKNIVVVAAAGNDGNTTPVNFPAAIARVIAVGATDRFDVLADFSCTGNALDLVAPGKGIHSTTNGGTSSLNIDGTSFSAPMVSGVAALIRSIDAAMSVDDIARYIAFYSDDLGAPGFDTAFGFGRLNAFRAIQAASARAPLLTNPGFSGETFPYPNPFRPSEQSKVTIALPASLGQRDLKITIMTVAGERVKTLTGTNEWDGRNDDGNLVASGLYFYYAETAAGNVDGKLTVIK